MSFESPHDSYTEEELLADLRARGIARPLPEHDRAGQACRAPGCDAPVPENSHRALNLGAGSGYCSLACLLDAEDGDD